MAKNENYIISTKKIISECHCEKINPFFNGGLIREQYFYIWFDSYLLTLVTDRTFGSAELLVCGSVQMTKLFSAEHSFSYYIQWHPFIFLFCLWPTCMVWFGQNGKTQLRSVSLTHWGKLTIKINNNYIFFYVDTFFYYALCCVEYIEVNHWFCNKSNSNGGKVAIVLYTRTFM